MERKPPKPTVVLIFMILFQIIQLPFKYSVSLLYNHFPHVTYDQLTAQFFLFFIFTHFHNFLALVDY